MKFNPEHMKLAREEKGLSQSTLARKLEVAERSLSRWEKGKGAPKKQNVIRMARILRCSLDYLYSEGE